MMKNEESEKERKAFKDWFDAAAAQRLADQVSGAHAEFDRKKFVRLATRGLSELEFHGRVQHFSNMLRKTLPESVPEALGILTRSLPDAQADCESVTDGWLQWPLGQFIADHGVPHFDESFVAMIELTKRFTSEFAVRPFVERYPEKVFARLRKLTGDPNPHVRRWCSEGVRPLLPWGRKLRDLVGDPSPLWPILEALKDDDELYVRRSVANTINDIAKHHPELVVQRCAEWSKDSNTNRDWLIKHALRTRIKEGDPGALKIIGYGPPKLLIAYLAVSPKRVPIGDSVTLSVNLESWASRAQNVMVDYAVHYVRKGDKSSAKVFKWKSLKIPAKGSVSLEKRHSMKLTTIRALYPGEHRVEVQVNGVRLADARFVLV
jgi:3-methyladenine DNA glycosylase AlkC